MPGRRTRLRHLGSAFVALLAGSAVALAGEGPPPRHLIYLHGRIIQEEQSARPKHPQYGYYELQKILDAFRERGFVVSGEIRPKPASVSESADRVVRQVRELLASGVPADHVTVVGASMGASIAFLASVRLHDPELRFGVLGACLSENVRALVADEGQGPSGHLLAIREASDDVDGSCTPWNGDAQARPGLVAREVVLHTGLGHGFLYTPLPEWVNPIAEWAGGAEAAEVRSVAGGIIDADNASDIARVLAFYAPDAVLLPPGEGPVVGRDAIRPRYQSLFAGFAPHIEGRVDEVCVSGGLAFVRGHNGGRLVARQTSEVRDLDDAYLMLLRRDADGAWRISHLMWHRGAPAVARPPAP